jgi:hypothetical protein
MKKYFLPIFLLILVISLLFTSCGEKKGQLKNEPMNINKLNEYSIDTIYGEKAELKEPQGLIVIDDKILVSDTKNNRLVLFDQSGNVNKIIGKTGNGQGEFIAPRGIALDKSGNIYIVDAGNKRIQILSNSFKFISQFTCDEFQTPSYEASGLQDVKVDTTGDMYITMSTVDKKYAYIYAIDSKKNVKKIGKDFTGVLSSVGEHIYFVSQLEFYKSKGQVGGQSGKHYLVDVLNQKIINTVLLPYSYTPVGIYGDNNFLYLVSATYGTIDRFDKQGKYLGSVFCQQADAEHEPGMSYMTMDGKANIYVCDHIKNVVYKLTKN